MRLTERVLGWLAAAGRRWNRLHRRWKIGTAVAFALGFAGVTAAGYRQWNYMQHDNTFCTSCHLMQDPFNRFSRSAHAKLECHSCHKARLPDQLRQMYLTLVERPEAIAGHADVPNDVCGACHVRGDSLRWRIIANTAGHRRHLESSNPALREMRCTTCHGVTVHEFASVDQTCGQAGCHATNQIRLGRMDQASELHCTACHSFLADARTVATDSLGRPLTPAAAQCLQCHAMQRRMLAMEIDQDPHRGVCGDCHNPHRQESPRQVSCTSGSCHAGWQTVSFHIGVPHPEECRTCHQPHSWRVDGQQCLRCHADIGRSGRSSPARRRAAREDDVGLRLAAAGASDVAPFPEARQAVRQERPAGLPPFSHGAHRGQTCATCHSSRQRHGQLMVRSAADCQRCHHAGANRQECVSCHSRAELERRPADAPRTFRLLAGRTTVTRSIRFEHARHDSLPCAQCHTNPQTRAPDGADCAGCHANHHRPAADCVACHGAANALASHTRATHATCGSAGCHGERAPTLPATRAACLVCHAAQSSHVPGRVCEECHRVTARRAS